MPDETVIINRWCAALTHSAPTTFNNNDDPSGTETENMYTYTNFCHMIDKMTCA